MTEFNDSYSQKEVAQLLGVTPASIAFYANEKLIIPEISNPVGRGKTRLYSKRNLIEILLLKELGKFGLNLRKIRQVISKFRLNAFCELAEGKPEFDTFENMVNYIKEKKPWGPREFNPEFLRKNRLYILIMDAQKKSSFVFTFYTPVDKGKPNETRLIPLMMNTGHDSKPFFTSAIVIDVTALFEKVAGI